MVKIWFDDKRIPPPGYNIWCKDFESALAVLQSNIVDEMSWDHDIAPEHYEDSIAGGYG